MNSTIKKIERLVKENIGVEEAVLVYAALTRLNSQDIEKDFGTLFVEKLQNLQKEHKESMISHAAVANFVRNNENVTERDIANEFGEDWFFKALSNSTIVRIPGSPYVGLGRSYMSRKN